MIASVAIHVGLLSLPLLRWPAARASQGRVDFWAGNTFEPSEVAEPGAAVLGGEDRTIDVEAVGSGVAVETPSEEIAADEAGMVERTPAIKARSPRVRVARARTSAGGVPSRAGASSPANGERSGGGTFGAEGAATGTRDLVRSFVRALPTVASSDAVWATLPLGSAGIADVALEIDSEHKPRLSEMVPPGVPSHLRRLIQKTVVVLSGGRFAATDEAPRRVPRLRVAVTLTQLRAPTDAERTAGGVFGLGFEGADARQVSRAFFTLASGRHVEVTVKPLPR